MLPNVIVPGAQKSGTSSLCDFIAAHPDCFLSSPKEPAFFSKEANLRNPDEYERFFEGGSQGFKVIAEGTTEYMINPLAPERLRAQLGEKLKFIFVLRSPEKRAFAGYTHLAKRGHETRSPEEIFCGYEGGEREVCAEERHRLNLALKDRRLKVDRYKISYDDWLWPFRYLENSFYSTAIQRYVEIFGADAVLALVFEEFFTSMDRLRTQLADFLDVDAAGFPDALPHSNPTVIPSISRLGYLGRSVVGKVVPSFRPRLAPVDRSVLQLKPTEKVLGAIQPLFEKERLYWSDYFGRDLRQSGWA